LNAPPGDFSEKYQRSNAAILPPDALGEGGHPSQGTPQVAKDYLVEACNLARLPSDRHTRDGSRQVWKFDDGRVVDQYAQGYDIKAADVVSEVRSLLRCDGYQTQDRGRGIGGRITVIRDVAAPAVAKVDGSLFFCEVASEKTRCVALLARDDVVTRIATVATSRERAEQLLNQVVPRVAERLSSAW
jgi:hypothetical protein